MSTLNYGKSNEIISIENGVATIKCSNCDDTFTVDEDKLDDLKGKTWSKHLDTNYLRTTINGKYVLLHRYLLREELNKSENKNKVVDHIDRNTLNNTLKNLRIVSYRTNVINSSASLRADVDVIGVMEREGKFNSTICVNNKDIRLGTFDTKYDAGLVYDSYIYHNLPEEDLKATNIYNNRIPQEELDKRGIDRNNLATIPFIPSGKQGNNNFRGVYYHDGKWVGNISTNESKMKSIGSFKTEIEAAAVREQYLLDHPELPKNNINQSNILWPEEKDGKINIAGIILTRDEYEEKTRGY